MPAHPSLFKKHKSDIFYESGTYQGDGVRAALEAGYTRIVTAEVFEPIYSQTKQKFVNFPQVTCLHGDTTMVLKNVLPTFVGKTVTFWLDGHYSGPGTGGEQNPFPIIEELQEILAAKNNSYISRPVILIDDMRLLKEKENLMIDIMRQIDPTYVFEYEDGFMYNQIFLKNDILVAR